MGFWSTAFQGTENDEEMSYEYGVYSSINDVPKDFLKEINPSNDVYFTSDFLESIEKNNKENIKFCYLCLVDEGKPICFATIQILDVNFVSGEGNLQLSCDPLRAIGFKLGEKIARKPFNVLICGNAFISGEHGICMVQNGSKKKIMKGLSDIVYKMVKRMEDFKTIDLILFKDFVNESLPITSELNNFSFRSFEVDPNMVLDVDSSWESLTDYSASLKAKYRTKFNAAFKKSSALEVKDLSHEELKMNIGKIKNLYESVEKKSAFNLGVLNLESYLDLKKSFPKSFIVRTYWLQGKMVGFLTGLINGLNFDAHFVGMDYDFNKECAIYSRMLYDYVGLAIDNKLTKVNFGRTAGEIKSTIGAVPEHLTCYVRHISSLTNHLIRPIVSYIKPSEFAIRKPFKDALG